MRTIFVKYSSKMDTFIIYHDVIMSLTAHMNMGTPLNPAAVATEVATNLDAFGALMSSISQPCGLTLPVDTNTPRSSVTNWTLHSQISARNDLFVSSRRSSLVKSSVLSQELRILQCRQEVGIGTTWLHQTRL